jgi:response regulator RpfG family c-di-GMP phosphodiesterase
MADPGKNAAPILVVDDEELIATTLGVILRQANYEAVALSQPTLALDELKNREFSVVISDQRMPGLSGLELLAEARRLQPNATRILMTGVLNLDTVIEAINQGEIYRFIVKPWLREEFLATVSNALQRYELLCQNARLQASTQAINEQLKLANSALEDKIQVVARQNRQLAEINQTLEKRLTLSLDFCVRALETFDPSLGAQARCVLQVCQGMATVLELPADERRLLESAARLYDIGIIALPRPLIRRWQENPGQLEASEADLVRQHPTLGQDLVTSVVDLEHVGEIIRAHHERFDGQGYPDGLKGENIPRLARLLAAAVAYASSSAPPDQALQAVKLGAGSLFDPEAVRVLVTALNRTGFPNAQREVPLEELAPGMILARGIYSHNGVLLVPQGQRLTETYIKKLVTHDHLHPLTQSLLVYC